MRNATEGVTLSGVRFSDEDCKADGTLEKLIKLSAEGAKRLSLISQAKGQSTIYSLILSFLSSYICLHSSLGFSAPQSSHSSFK